MDRRFVSISLVLAIAACGCDGRGKSRPAMLADAAPPPEFTTPAKAPDPRFAADPFWTAAASEDPLDLAALADQEGATGLLEGLEQGGSVGLTALHALPYADDAELAYRRLAEVALQTKDDTQLDILVTIRRIAEDAHLGGEPLDPGGPNICIRALGLVAKDGAVKRNRSEAVAALRAFAYRGALDPALVPTLD